MSTQSTSDFMMATGSERGDPCLNVHLIKVLDGRAEDQHRGTDKRSLSSG